MGGIGAAAAGPVLLLVLTISIPRLIPQHWQVLC